MRAKFRHIKMIRLANAVGAVKIWPNFITIGGYCICRLLVRPKSHIAIYISALPRHSRFLHAHVGTLTTTMTTTKTTTKTTTTTTTTKTTNNARD